MFIALSLSFLRKIQFMMFFLVVLLMSKKEKRIF
jgi:hypothetical protein